MGESKAGRAPFGFQIQDLLDHKEEKEREGWRKTERVGETYISREEVGKNAQDRGGEWEKGRNTS